MQPLSQRSLMDRFYRRIGLIALLLLVVFLLVKLLNFKLLESRSEREDQLIIEKIRATAKLVIWEEEFTLSNITQAEHKYLGSDYLTFTEKVFTKAKGKMGFHIDLGDTINTTYRITGKNIEIRTPLRLTYVSIDNGTVQQIKESSYDPTLEVDKEQIVRSLNEIALHEKLAAALNQVKKLPLSAQEKTLSALTGRQVKIVLTDMPTLQSALHTIHG